MERRKNTRIKIKEHIVVEAGSLKKNAIAYDVSRTGMFFIFLEKFEKGDVCSVEIGGFNFSGEVKWAKKINDTEQVFRYGIEFSSELSQEQFQSLIN